MITQEVITSVLVIVRNSVKQNLSDTVETMVITYKFSECLGKQFRIYWLNFERNWEGFTVHDNIFYKTISM